MSGRLDWDAYNRRQRMVSNGYEVRRSPDAADSPQRRVALRQTPRSDIRDRLVVSSLREVDCLLAKGDVDAARDRRPLVLAAAQLVEENQRLWAQL
jgi:hypothetical protein